MLEDAKMTLVNPPELFLDVGIDGIENTLDQGEGDGLFTLVDYASGRNNLLMIKMVMEYGMKIVTCLLFNIFLFLMYWSKQW